MNAFFTNLKLKLKAFFGRGSAFQAIVETALQNIFRVASATALDLLAAVAAQKVAELNGAPSLSNDEKRQQALNALQTAAIKEGLQVSQSLLNLILETAVNAAKK